MAALLRRVPATSVALAAGLLAACTGANPHHHRSREGHSGAGRRERHGRGRVRASIPVGRTSRFATPALAGRDVLVPTLAGLAAVRTS